MPTLKAPDADGLAVDDVAVRQPTLDEVFLALTGHSATDADASSPHAEAAAA